MKRIYLFSLLATILLGCANEQNIDDIDTLRVCTDVSIDKMAVRKGKKWPPKTTLRVRFIGGSSFVREKVKRYAVEWSKYCNIKFKFVSSGDAEIRVAFVPGRGSWSLLGDESKNWSVNPKTKRAFSSKTGVTMNFGWFNESTSEENFRTTTLHEFGHALGCVHEHQSPSSGMPWNKPEVYRYYRATDGWTPEEVDHNVIKKYSKSGTQYSKYDKKSIMIYPIPAFLLLDPNYAVDWNTELSETDKAFIRTAYTPEPYRESAIDRRGGGNPVDK